MRCEKMLWLARRKVEETCRLLATEDHAAGLCHKRTFQLPLVGHTPVSACGLVPISRASAGGIGEGRRLVACDTFSLTSSFEPIGDGSMLLVRDGKMTVAGGEDDDLLELWDLAVLDWMHPAR